MNRNRNDVNGKKGKGGKPYSKGKGRDKREDREERVSGDNKRGDYELDNRKRDNDPNWYFRDKALADQTSALSFQQLAGQSIVTSEATYPVGNIVAISLSPAPGVTPGATGYDSLDIQSNGINLAGFKLFSKLSAYTGRKADYAPSDISIMILKMGEVLSQFEWIRRCFGVANIYSLRNRAYPRAILRAMSVDPDDLFTNLANYRMRFNGLVTLLNQVPIPKGIPYFDKCAALYEKIYVDQNSPMAQTLFYTMGTTWNLDEQTDPSGSRLRTDSWTTNYLSGLKFGAIPMSNYLNFLERSVMELLNSSTFQVVYTDLLNLSVKLGTKFWVLDYLFEGYTVAPEFNMNFLLQVHNCTINGLPIKITDDTYLSSDSITPFNDVVSCPNVNGVFYNPMFSTINNVVNGRTVTPENFIVDMLTAEPSVEDRVEVLRFACSAGTRRVSLDGENGVVDNSLTDHYVNGITIYNTDNSDITVTHAILGSSELLKVAYALCVIDWAPRLYELASDGVTLTGHQIGDLNFYTVVTPDYIRRLNNFVALNLYDIN
jgi:hypothetical protein